MQSRIINHCFSRVFWLFEEYYCSEDIYVKYKHYKIKKKLVTDSLLAKFYDTIFIEADIDLIILVHMTISLGVFLFDMVFL